MSLETILALLEARGFKNPHALEAIKSAPPKQAALLANVFYNIEVLAQLPLSDAIIQLLSTSDDNTLHHVILKIYSALKSHSSLNESELKKFIEDVKGQPLVPVTSITLNYENLKGFNKCA